MTDQISSDAEPTVNASHLDAFHTLRRILEEIEVGEHLFPRPCRNCQRTFHSFSEYLLDTVPIGNTFKDYTADMGKPYAMVYRHCICANTLVMTLTADTFPSLERFVAALRKEAARCGREPGEVAGEFTEWLQDCLCRSE